MDFLKLKEELAREFPMLEVTVDLQTFQNDADLCVWDVEKIIILLVAKVGGVSLYDYRFYKVGDLADETGFYKLEGLEKAVSGLLREYWKKKCEWHPQA